MNQLRELWRAFHKWAKGWDTSVVVAVLIWIVLRSYLIEAFRIPSASMENTLLVGDFLFVNKAIYGGELEIPGTGLRFLRVPGYAEPERGGIVVFRSVEDSTPNLNIVKRVIGAGGDTLRMVHDTLYRNGQRLDEPYALHLAGGSEVDPDFRLQQMRGGSAGTGCCSSRGEYASRGAGRSLGRMGLRGSGPAARHDGPSAADGQPEGVHAASGRGLRDPYQPADQSHPAGRAARREGRHQPGPARLGAR